MSAADTRLEAYIAALKRMDWTFERSDDDRIHRAGWADLAHLRAEQPVCDPSGALWRAQAWDCPGVPQPRVAA